MAAMCSATVANPQQIPAQPMTPTHDRGTSPAQAAPPTTTPTIAAIHSCVLVGDDRPMPEYARPRAASRAGTSRSGAHTRNSSAAPERSAVRCRASGRGCGVATADTSTRRLRRRRRSGRTSGNGVAAVVGEGRRRRAGRDARTRRTVRSGQPQGSRRRRFVARGRIATGGVRARRSGRARAHPAGTARPTAVDVHVEVAVQAAPPDGSSRSSSAAPRSCSGRRVGKSTTSRIDPTSASSITNRSMPMPRPTVGGRPYSRARR